jgi:hypothetical protein
VPREFLISGHGYLAIFAHQNQQKDFQFQPADGPSLAEVKRKNGK